MIPIVDRKRTYHTFLLLKRFQDIAVTYQFHPISLFENSHPKSHSTPSDLTC